jgi:hypothetical protein
LEDAEKPIVRFNLALLGTEDRMLAGSATADYVFGAAPDTGSDRDARMGCAMIWHKHHMYSAKTGGRDGIGGTAQKAYWNALAAMGAG